MYHFLPPLQVGLPSPSDMIWADGKKILVSTPITTDSSELMDSLPPAEKGVLESELKDVNAFFKNVTEMDANIRVALVILAVIKKLPESTRSQIKVECQPTFIGHSTFTDFMIVMASGIPKLIIEVRNSSINTNLTLEVKSTAQIIREVHIVTEKLSGPIPFVITNSIGWSFGLAKRVANKVLITSTKHLDISVSPSCYDDVFQLLTKYLTF